MKDTKTKTLRQLLTEIASHSYDQGDYAIIKNTKKEEEVARFVDIYLPGTKILKDGKDGAPVTLQGKLDENTGVTGDEELICHDYLLYDLTGQSGEWLVVTFKTKEEVEKHILSEAGYLNFYCTEMLVFHDGIYCPFEVLFAGDNDITIAIDKDRFDEELDIKGMQSRISVNWIQNELTAEEKQAFFEPSV